MGLSSQNYRTPNWVPKTCVNRRRLHPTLVSWLLDTDSLTHRFQKIEPCDFRVKVLDQWWSQATVDEALALGLPPRQACIARHVVLQVGDLSCVFARTILPAKTLGGGAKQLSQLGAMPLGGVLFADKRIQRRPLEIGCLTAQHKLYDLSREQLTDCPEQLWARRSVFSVQQKPLLVHEVFLPDITKIA